MRSRVSLILITPNSRKLSGSHHSNKTPISPAAEMPQSAIADLYNEGLLCAEVDFGSFICRVSVQGQSARILFP